MHRERFLIGFGLALVFAIVLGELASRQLNLAQFQAILERELSSAAGLEAHIDGGLELHLVPVPRLQAKGVRFANLPGRPSPALLSIESLDLVVDVWKSIVGPLEIDHLKLSGVAVHLESDAEGRFEVEHEAESLVDESATGPIDLRLRSLSVEDAKVFFLDGARKVGTTLAIDELHLDADDFSAPIAVMATGSVDGGGFELRGEVGSLAALLTPTGPFPIAVSGQLLEAGIEASGSIGAPFALTGIDLQIAATVPDLMQPLRRTGHAVPRVGPARVSGRLGNSEGSYGLRDIRVQVNGDSPVQGEVSGSIADVAKFTGVDLTADLTAANLAFLAPFVGAKLPAEFALATRFALSDRDGSLGIAGDASLRSPDGVTLEAKGDVGDLDLLDSIDVRVRIRADDLASLAPLAELVAAPVSLPAMGPVDASGRLSKHGERMGIDDLALQIGPPATVWAKITGSVADIQAFRGVNLQAEVNGAGTDLMKLAGVGLTAELTAAKLAFLAPFIDAKQPARFTLATRLALSDRDGSLGVAGDASLRSPDGLTLEAKGEVGDLERLDPIDVRVRIRAGDLASLDEFRGLAGLGTAPVPLPRVGPIDASGRLRNRSERLGIDDLSVKFGPPGAAWATIAGSIADIEALRGVSLQLSIDADDARTLLAHLEHTLPDVGPLRGGARLHDTNGPLGLEGLELHAGRGDTLSLHVRGSCGDLRKIDAVDFEVKLAATSAADLGALLGIELPRIGPVAFDGHGSGTGGNVRSEGVLTVARSSLSGSWAASFAANERVHVSARVESPHVHLDDIPQAAHRGDAAAANPPSWRGAEIPLEELRAFDADVTLLARRITGRANLDLSDVRGSLHLANGVLTLRDVAASSGTGSGTLELELDTHHSPPTTSLEFEARNVDLARLLAQFALAPEHTGHLDASIALRSRGATASAIQKRLSGRLAARLRDSNVASLYGQKFVQQVAYLAIPNFQLKRTDPVDCLAMGFEFENGIASVTTLRLDGAQASITGSGSIDLAAGTYDLRVVPKAHDPSLFSIAAAVDVTGPLAKPKFTPVIRTIASSATRAIFKNALKPASLIMRSLNFSGAGGEVGPCAGAFDPTRHEGGTETPVAGPR